MIGFNYSVIWPKIFHFKLITSNCELRRNFAHRTRACTFARNLTVSSLSTGRALDFCGQFWPAQILGYELKNESRMLKKILMQFSLVFVEK